MILNNFPSSQYGRGLSIQSCFPEIKSVANSSCKSSGEDDASLGIFSDDNLSLRDAFGLATFDHGHYETTVNFASDIQLSQLQPHHEDEPVTTPVDFLEVQGFDAHAVLDPSIWPFNESSDRIPSISAEPNTQAADAEDVQRNCFTAFVPLHNAALKGDWKVAREFLILNPQAVCARITRNMETALHIAAGARHTTFVQELVNIMTPEDLALQNKVGNTALCFAAISGIKKIAEVMVDKNKRLSLIRGSKGATPLCMAALLGHREMVWYLYSVTQQEYLNEEDRIELLVAVINAGIYDLALDLIKKHPELAVARDGKRETALHVLARKPSAFVRGSQLGLWRRCIYAFPRFRAILENKLMHLQALELVKQLWEQVLLLDDYKIGELIRKPSRLLFTAAEMGNVEFIKILIRMYPDLIWKVDDHSRSIFHIAVMHRQENIFNLIHEIGAHKDLIAAYEDEYKDNMLHLAGKLAPPDRLKIDSGAALQLRRELHWFKKVEQVVQPSYRETKNSEGRTPQMLFSEEHRRLVREGEKWMKDTASSCMVVSTLIATVMFAAAFTVPGGNDNVTGRPIFLHQRSFLVFAISDALALFCSATSILMFLSILTSRYAEEDFLHSLPNRLITGLAALFISIATMMAAFGATLFIVLSDELAWIAIPIATAACIPATLFALLQFPLLSDMINHLYNSSIFSSPDQKRTHSTSH
ncbi:ankyrin repeat-containing protein NPR4-like [Mangifera indica]|uniref:ankyrin repeat-containing protein NPR4-like n=1 Tax=Mangifera indica TaxID=29780 RepID=UPI001CFC0D54|nr:ankyrin repeat-containing protein NPR4-like [Mangifera indica]